MKVICLLAFLALSGTSFAHASEKVMLNCVVEEVTDSGESISTLYKNSLSISPADMGVKLAEGKDGTKIFVSAGKTFINIVFGTKDDSLVFAATQSNNIRTTNYGLSVDCKIE